MMHVTNELALRTVLVGLGATVVMDLWGAWVKRAYGAAPLDYRLVGRWLLHMLVGRLMHAKMAEARPVVGEAVLGWVAHYLTGVVFAAGLLLVVGMEWARQPTLGPALLTGVVTIVVPFFVMQPCWGLGWAASKTPDPTAARLRSLLTHASFGVGLYLAAAVAARLLG